MDWERDKESSLTEASSVITAAELSDGGESTHGDMEAGETDGREVIENSEEGGHAILADGEAERSMLPGEPIPRVEPVHRPYTQLRTSP